MQKVEYKTRQKDLLFSYFQKMKGKHFTAEDALSYFAKKDINIGIATIYRGLEKFVADGTLQKYFIDDHTAACFEYSGEKCSADEKHFHLKCEGCQKLFHLECEELTDISEHLQKEHKFYLNPYRTVFYGLCKNCTPKNANLKRGVK